MEPSTNRDRECNQQCSDEDEKCHHTKLSPYRNKVDSIGPDAVSWIKATKLVSKVTGLSSVLSWCQQCVKKGIQVAGQAIWPHSQQYREELQRALLKLEKLEKEMNQMKHEKTKHKEPSTAMVSPLCSPCRCMCSRCGKQIAASRPATCVPGITPSAAPPVPPPPPPPPPLMTRKVLPITRVQNKKKKEQVETGRKQLKITTEDLMAVKLRKREVTNMIKMDSSGSDQLDGQGDNLGPISTLRKTLHSDEHDKENAQARIAKEVVGFKRKLKKTEMKRSPGGTPIISRSKKRRSGQGLTGIMSRALKEKFSSAISMSSDESAGNSPSSPKVRRSSPRLSQTINQEEVRSK